MPLAQEHRQLLLHLFEIVSRVGGDEDVVQVGKARCHHRVGLLGLGFHRIKLRRLNGIKVAERVDRAGRRPGGRLGLRALAREPVFHGRPRRDGGVVLVLAGHARALPGQQADDAHRDVVDPHVLPDRAALAEQCLGRRLPEDHHARHPAHIFIGERRPPPADTSCGCSGNPAWFPGFGSANSSDSR